MNLELAALVVLLVAGMLAVGTSLDATALGALPVRLLLSAVAVNLIAVPAVAVAATWATGLTGSVATGVVLAAAAAGGASGPLLARHARGDLALAVSLQAVVAVGGLAAVPLWLPVAPGGADFGTDGSATLVVAMLVGQAVPLAVGMVLRARRPSVATRVHAVSRRVADVVLAAVVLWYLATATPQLLALPTATVPVLVLVVASSAAAYAAPLVAGAAQRSAVAMITMVRNLTLALALAGLARDSATTSTVLAYGLVMYLLAVAAVFVLRPKVRTAA